jgi:hypothetical protein
MEPLKPIVVFFFRIILITPLIPSGLYFAEGFVIRSKLFTEEEGICFNNFEGDKFDGFPSIKTRTLLFPFKLMVRELKSTSTDGIFSNNCKEFVPAEAKYLRTLMTLLSIF